MQMLGGLSETTDYWETSDGSASPLNNRKAPNQILDPRPSNSSSEVKLRTLVGTPHDVPNHEISETAKDDPSKISEVSLQPSVVVLSKPDVDSSMIEQVTEKAQLATQSISGS
jgi:hypothetical protein